MTRLKILFGKRLKQLRRNKGLTQAQLAEAARVSVDLISNIERGVNAPSFDTVEKICEVLGIEAQYLFRFDE